MRRMGLVNTNPHPRPLSIAWQRGENRYALVSENRFANYISHSTETIAENLDRAAGKRKPKNADSLYDRRAYQRHSQGSRI